MVVVLFDVGVFFADFLGESKAGVAIENAAIQIINTKIKSLAAGKMGYTTKEVGDLVCEAL